MSVGAGFVAQGGPKVSVVRDAAILSTPFWKNAVFACAEHVAIKRL